MMHVLRRSLIFALVAVCLGAMNLHAEPLTPDELKFFETKIRPVLVKECYGCHSNKAGNVRGGLRLDTKQLTYVGGSSGPAIVPGDLEGSLLYNAIIHEDFVMPPKRKLADSVIADFRKWIEMGAPDPRENKIAEIKSTITDEDIQDAKENFWAYKKPVRQTPPRVENTDWIKTDVDRFVLAKLEQSELQPAQDAESYKVLRRICFDLVGLPPTPKQIDYFSKIWAIDPDKAISHVVDRMLDSPQFGERWGRHWLDVARYAESTGRGVNMTYPHAWRYRDYVIDSFNADKPFDQFVQEQIAGDLLPAKTDQQWADNLVATGFLAMGPKNVNEQNAVQFRADLVDEQIDTTTRVFLGASVACARCHDHKFDAIPQTDYYAMAGIFAGTTTFFGNPPSELGSFSNVQARRQSSLLLLPVDDPNPYDKKYSPQELADLRGQLDDARQQLFDMRRGGQSGSTGGANPQQQRIRLNNVMAGVSAKLAVVDSDGNPRSYCMGVQDGESSGDVRVLVRGEIDQPGQSVPRGAARILCDDPLSITSRSSGRLELARLIGSDANPLTARVMVNRIWQHLIGKGIVTSTENFGVTGQAPSHPELLDHLAVQFVDSGWSVKTIVREIATSHVYRIRSTYDERKFQYDPDNALVWRANPRRLDAEAMRDAMLSVSGQIDLDRPRGSEVAKAGYVRVRDGVVGDPRELARAAVESMRAGGATSRGGQTRGGFGQAGQQGRGRFGSRGRSGMQGAGGQSAYNDVVNRVQNQLDMQDAKFRSVYLPIVRDEVPRSLEVFDFADSNTVIGTRESSNTANQALYMMNNPFVIAQSEALARRVADEGTRVSDQIEAAFLLTYGRPPTSGERAATASFLKTFAPTTSFRSRGAETLTALCQSLFASAEFRYID